MNARSRARSILRTAGILLLLSAFGFAAPGCQRAAPPEAGDLETVPVLGAGFRYSTYGPRYDPGPNYWAGVGLQMAKRFPDAAPQGIWIVGQVSGLGTFLNFPADSPSPRIQSAATDDNEYALSLFDEKGIQVWLQVEPGDASIEELIHILLNRYGEHPSVIGVGVDVEWYRSHERPEGEAVTDEQAASWLAAVRSHGSRFRLFLKHWLIEKMPPTVRDGIVFIDDSQDFPSLDAMVREFAVWGQHFAPAPVGFQFGYPADRAWWSLLDDPPGEIGERILSAVPNTESLFWVDFSVIEVFPP